MCSERGASNASSLRAMLVVTLMTAVGACGDFAESTDDLGMTTLDAHGGTVTFQALTVEVPAAALATSVTFRTTAAAPSGALTGAYHVEPDGHRFDAAARVSWSLAGLTLPPLTEVFLADFNHRPPQPLANRVLEVDGTQLHGTTTTTGTFGLLHCPHATCPR